MEEFPGSLEVEDLALSCLWLRSLLWCAFDPWPGLWEWPKKKKKKTSLRYNQNIIQFTHPKYTIQWFLVYL